MEQKYLTYETVLDGFEEFENSEKTAVICGKERITYRELIRKAKKAAGAMAAEGVKKGDRVILSIPYSVDFICGYLAILYAGAAYVAIDRAWPEERLDLIRSDSGAIMTLTEDCLKTLLAKDVSESLPRMKGEDPFALYYTSGSTGKPKGALIHHKMVLTIVLPVRENVCYAETLRLCDRIFIMGNFAYEAVLGDLLFSLFSGKTMILATDEERQDPALLGQCMISNQADAAMGTPSMLLRYLEDLVFADAFASLKRLSFIGEPLSVPDAERISKKTDAVLFDAFGTSEVGFFAYCRVMPGEEVTLDYPTYGTMLLVLGDDGKPVQEGETGELCIGGSLSLYSEYYGLPELTDMKYQITKEYGRIYHTGDRVVLLSGGRLKMAGRKDDLVKLHGQRLEPREIELAMESFSDIRQAAVAVRGTGKDAILCAWYSSEDPIDENLLREYLADRLPGYMIPVRMKRMKELPLNTSGKLDRRSLPDIEESESLNEAPVNEREKLICTAFANILTSEKPVGRNDNFFLLGGDSMLGMMLVSELARKYGLYYSMTDLFRRPTPMLLASLPSGKAIIETDDSSCPYVLPEEIRAIAEDDDNVQAVFPVNNSVLSYLIIQKNGLTGALEEMRTRTLLDCAYSEEEFRDRVSTLVRVHPALRSYFVMDSGGEYWQVFRKHADPAAWYKDIRHLETEDRERFLNGFWQVFDSDESLWKIACLITEDHKSVILFSISHTIADGVSLSVILNELCSEQFQKHEEDGLLFHRRILTHRKTELPEWVKEYYDGPDLSVKAFKHLSFSKNKWDAEELRLSKKETKECMTDCFASGIMFYSWVQFCYGQAILELLDRKEIWIMTLESGRYAQWGDELGIVGNLTVGIPVKVTKGQDITEFNEYILKLRDQPALSESSIAFSQKWIGLYEGVLSNDFPAPAYPIINIELINGEDRNGNSMKVVDGELIIEIRHIDSPEEKKWAEQLKEVFYHWLHKRQSDC